MQDPVQYLLSCSNEVRIWDFSNRKAPYVLCNAPEAAHKSKPVNGVVWTSNNCVCVSAGSDGHVALTLLRPKKSPTIVTTPSLLIPSMQLEEAAIPRPLRAVSITQNSRFLVSGGDSNELYIYSLKTKRMQDVLTIHQSPITAVASSPSVDMTRTQSEDHIASGDDSGKVAVTRIVYDDATKHVLDQTVTSLSSHPNKVTALSFGPTPTQPQLLASDALGLITLYTCTSGVWRETGRHARHDGSCVACFMASSSSDMSGHYIASAGSDGHVCVSTVSDLADIGHKRKPFFDHYIPGKRFTSIAARGSILAVGTDSGEVFALDMAASGSNAVLLARFNENPSRLPVKQLSFSTMRVPAGVRPGVSARGPQHLMPRQPHQSVSPIKISPIGRKLDSGRSSAEPSGESFRSVRGSTPLSLKTSPQDEQGSVRMAIPRASVDTIPSGKSAGSVYERSPTRPVPAAPSTVSARHTPAEGVIDIRPARPLEPTRLGSESAGDAEMAESEETPSETKERTPLEGMDEGCRPPQLMELLKMVAAGQKDIQEKLGLVLGKIEDMEDRISKVESISGQVKAQLVVGTAAGAGRVRPELEQELWALV
ncbi:WD domain G-beta repeat [Carpediemonas membranifera]|uniref:WD domain G-beta repeat n=1 Tax=Carpediemonas membranifera TaxID=201153 RepID=A0A8J6B5E6_9EUKA|nr:WD domain G-beta repeat [Carpediemonas membranifera]|eukprot:KAG9396033.1 WD domain G-beta repeat [Carpediemonas membranifera]